MNQRLDVLILIQLCMCMKLFFPGLGDSVIAWSCFGGVVLMQVCFWAEKKIWLKMEKRKNEG